MPFVPNDEPAIGARPLESLASQSQPILGNGGLGNDDPYAAENGTPGVIVKEKKKKSDKKKD